MKVYLDNAATTELDERVKEEMRMAMDQYGNPSSIHSKGKAAKRIVERARCQVAKAIGANPDEIYFTSGGTEADNWAIIGGAYGNQYRGRRIITTEIEHHAVLNACKWLEGEEYDVTYLPVNAFGLTSVDELSYMMSHDTSLVSVMYVNNELGTRQPIQEMGHYLHNNHIAHCNPLFHVDAVQAIGYVDVKVNDIECDLMSLSAHKFHGPKGVGALYIKRGTYMTSLLHAGGQQWGLRPGTENVVGIVGMGVAIELSQHYNKANIKLLTDLLAKGLMRRIKRATVNSHDSSQNIVSVSFEGVDAETLVLHLSNRGIYCSAGAACDLSNIEPSHVLTAIGLSKELARGTVRFSLSDRTTKEEIEYVLDTVPAVVEELRQQSLTN